MVSIDELKTKFNVFPMPPYGDCLIVDMDRFDPVWRDELASQGFSCFRDVLDGYPVFFVPLNKMAKVESAVVEGLMVKFGQPQVVPLRGECIVVPQEQFSSELEVALAAEGLRCLFSDWGGRAVVFVQLKKSVAGGGVVYVPPPKPEPTVQSNHLEVKKVENEESKETRKHGGGWANKWTPEEDKILLDAAGDVKFAVNRLIKPLLDSGKLSGRTLESCLWRVSHLRKKAAKKPAQPFEWTAPMDGKKDTGDISATKDEKSTASTEGPQVYAADPFKAIEVLFCVFEKLQGDLVELKVRVESLASISKKETEALARVVGDSFASKADVAELKKGIDNLLFAVGKASQIDDRIDEVLTQLRKHEHSEKTGKIMLPMEATS